jgi:predicted metalloprotease
MGARRAEVQRSASRDRYVRLARCRWCACTDPQLDDQMNRRTTVFKIKALAALLALALVGAACGGGSDDGSVFDGATGSTTTAQPGDGGDTDDGNVDLDVEVDEPIRPMRPSEQDEEPVAQDADTVMIAAAIDVGAFWEQRYPELYGEPLPELSGGFWSYGPSTPEEELPPCGGDIQVVYNDIAQNAFYCPSDDLIAWDREGLVEPFIDAFGAFTAALVMAHEYGHAVQERSGDSLTLPQVYLELQADCFAGAWVGNVVDGNSDVFQATVAELDVAVAGLIEIRDVPGSSPDDPSAHGSGFDRVSAFSDGLFDGVERCADYATDPPIVTEDVFTVEEEASGGNLSPDELLPLLYADLEDFYTQLFATSAFTWTPVADIVFYDPDVDEVTCGGEVIAPEDAVYQAFYCIPDNVALIDAAYLLPELNDIGDFALAVQIARQWAFAAQVQLGNTDDTIGTSLHADCLTGLYAGDVYFQLRPDTAQLVLSAGDLDEAIISFIEFGTPGDDSVTGTPFQRSDAFRTGFIGFVEDCDSYLE